MRPLIRFLTRIKECIEVNHTTKEKMGKWQLQCWSVSRYERIKRLSTRELD